MSDIKQQINVLNTLSVNGEEAQATTTQVNDDFFLSNKKTTIDYRAAMALAIGTTGQIAKIVQMSFGIGGETDTQGNPAPPSDNGALNSTVLTVDIKNVSYPVPTTVCFEAEIPIGTVTAAINEVALIDEDGRAAAKMRLLTSKGTDAESGLNFKWFMEF